jgi:uncharacterized phage protein (TIGR02216 family)
MALAFGVGGLAPRVFWAMTPRELDAALRGRLGFGVHAHAPLRTEMAALMQRYPDEKERADG